MKSTMKDKVTAIMKQTAGTTKTRRITGMVLSILMLVSLFGLAACSGDTKNTSSQTDPKNESSQTTEQQSDIEKEVAEKSDDIEDETKDVDASQKDVDASSADPTSNTSDIVEGNFTIGISQFAQHGSLDNCREGFLLGLAEQGFVEGENLTIDYQNAGAEMAVASQIAETFVGKKYDLIMAVATPAAMHAYNAAMDKNIPVIYSAVSDPVAAELAKPNGESVGNITGTSDALPVEAQLKMIREIMPDAETIGIIYTTSETNSEATVKIYEELAPKYDFKLVISGIATSADIPLATDNILTKVDCLSNLTDNTVVESLPTILDKAFAANIPIFGSEVEQVSLGCLASEGVDYITLGKETGYMAAQVLRGEKTANELNFETISESFLYVNSATAEKLGIEIPESMSDRALENFSEIGVLK
ncbi:MAG: ABC transporter substrate-binding protein [Saccharofermentanales bacterium]|jgi:putative ABC transport system substrate-binding protein